MKALFSLETAVPEILFYEGNIQLLVLNSIMNYKDD